MNAVSAGWFKGAKAGSLVLDVEGTGPGFVSVAGCNNSLFRAGLGSALLVDGSPDALLVVLFGVRHVPVHVPDDQLLNLSSSRFAAISATFSAPSFLASGIEIGSVRQVRSLIALVLHWGTPDSSASANSSTAAIDSR